MPGSLVRLAAFLSRLLRPAWSRRAAARVVEQRDVRDGVVHDRYEPAGRVHGWQIVVHGVTVNGKDDPRLVHFCRCLASVGVACIAPTLPGLASLEWLPSDVDRLAELAASIAAGRGPIGLAGFSFGGSVALVAAARPDCASAVGSVFACGAYHSLDDLCDDLAATAAAPGADVEARPDLDDWLYLRLVAAWRQRARLGLREDEAARLRSLLRGYCGAPPTAEALAFYRETLGGRDPVLLDVATRDASAFAAVSPATRLATLRCPVAVLHDATDTLVPPHHASRIAGELSRAHRPHRLAVTRLLRHVGVVPVSTPADVVRVLATLVTLVRPAEVPR